MGKITLYTTGCPRCKVLEKKLEQKGIKFEKNNNVDEMMKLGFSEAPILKVENEVMRFSEANKWLTDKNNETIGDCETCKLEA